MSFITQQILTNCFGVSHYDIEKVKIDKQANRVILMYRNLKVLVWGVLGTFCCGGI